MIERVFVFLSTDAGSLSLISSRRSSGDPSPQPVKSNRLRRRGLTLHYCNRGTRHGVLPPPDHAPCGLGSRSTTQPLTLCSRGQATAGVSRTRMGCPEGAFCAHIEERETLSPRGKGTENAAAVAPRSQDRQAQQETTGAAPSGNEEGAPPRGTQRQAARPRGDDDDRAHRRRQPGPSGKARHEAPLGPG